MLWRADSAATKPGLAGGRRPVARIAPHGPGSDPLPSHRSRTGEPRRQRRSTPGASRTHLSGGVGGSQPEAGRCPDGGRSGRDPRDGGATAHRPPRSDRSGPHRPPARSGGHRARIGHAGRHASALGGRAGVRWVDVDPDASREARVFGLRAGREVSNRIALAAKAAGLIGRFSGHSPRRPGSANTKVQCVKATIRLMAQH